MRHTEIENTFKRNKNHQIKKLTWSHVRAPGTNHVNALKHGGFNEIHIEPTNSHVQKCIEYFQ